MSTGLYIVPTPIGNLEDITLRAIRILRQVDLVLAEDTRVTGRLLKEHDVDANLSSYHVKNEHAKTPHLIDQLQAGQSMALVTNAGMPAISDPGFLIVRACRKEGIPVSSLPGPTAFVCALAGSGLPADRFHFEGFLPHKKGRNSKLEALAQLDCTFILYESPYRVLKCLKQLVEHCGPNRYACVARELTKLHEEYITSTLSELLEEFESRDKIKGEFVIVVAPGDYTL